MEDKEKLKRYYSDDVDVFYSRERCIHYAACVRGLPSVFNTSQRPWVKLDDSDPDMVAEVVLRCPTGALHYERKDGGVQEATPEKNTIRIAQDGPLYVKGDVTLVAPDGTVILEDTRIALCRCGESKNKPFCDNSHKEINFSDPGRLRANSKPSVESPKPLKITPTQDGPYLLRGNFEIIGSDGETVFRGRSIMLCRCGHSKDKPFCDDSHLEVGFRS